MTVTAVQRAALPGIPADYEAAFGQVWHNYAKARLTVPAPQLVEMDCNIGVRGEGFEYIFSRGKGLVSIRYNGVQLLDDTVRPNFWRARLPTTTRAVQSPLNLPSGRPPVSMPAAII